MSYILDTDVAPFCHGQNHSGSVPVPSVCVAAVLAPEVSLVQFESLGSRETLAARHGRVCGPDHHHLPPGPPSTVDEFPLGRTDRGISSFARHGGLRQELRFEVFDGDQVVVVDNAFGPDPRIMDGSPGGSLRQPGSILFGFGIAPRLGSRFAVTPGHFALRLRRLCSTAPAVAQMWEIKDRISGDRGSGYTPVDTYTTLAEWRIRDCPAYDERGIPMPETVLADADRRRLGRQLPRPDDRNRDALRQCQAALTKREPSLGVLQRRQGCLAGLGLWATTPLHREGLVERPRVVAQCLLLGDLGTFAQPRHRRSRQGEQLPEPSERRSLPGSLLVNCFVPQPSTTPPLGQQRCPGSAPGPKPVRVPHHLINSNILSNRVVMHHNRHLRLFLSAVNDGVSKAHTR